MLRPLVYDLFYDLQYSDQGLKLIILLLESYANMPDRFDHVVYWQIQNYMD